MRTYKQHQYPLCKPSGSSSWSRVKAIHWRLRDLEADPQTSTPGRKYRNIGVVKSRAVPDEGSNAGRSD